MPAVADRRRRDDPFGGSAARIRHVRCRETLESTGRRSYGRKCLPEQGEESGVRRRNSIQPKTSGVISCGTRWSTSARGTGNPFPRRSGERFDGPNAGPPWCVPSGNRRYWHFGKRLLIYARLNRSGMIRNRLSGGDTRPLGPAGRIGFMSETVAEAG